MRIPAVLVLAAVAGAQSNPRFELAWRVRAMEREWAARDGDARERALPGVEAAVRCFFGADAVGAAEQLDAARAALSGVPEPWAASLAIAPRARLVDAQTVELELAVTRWYEVVDEREVGLTVRAPGDERARLDSKVPGSLDGA